MVDQPTSRQSIRAWISEQRGALEQAQASGTLARTKLDLKDAAKKRFPDMQNTSDFNAILGEEMDAVCADLRLADITVQQQVERKTTSHTVRAVLLAVVAFFITLVITALNVKDPVTGFGLPILVGGIVFFLAR
jgi:hypothetical protein